MDLSISDMVAFQERRDESGHKVCVLNLEAFSVFINKNKNNSDAIKKLIDDIIAMNKILAGNSNPILVTPRLKQEKIVIEK